MFVPNFKILGPVVPEKSLTKKKKFTHTHTEKAKTIYPLYTSYTGGINIKVTNRANVYCSATFDSIVKHFSDLIT